MHRYSTKRGFTLIELLVVMTIIAILMGLLMPAIGAIRRAARKTQCSNNLRNVVLAAKRYESDFSHYPSAGGSLFVDNTGATNLNELSLFYHLLPHLEESALQDRIFPLSDGDEPVDSTDFHLNYVGPYGVAISTTSTSAFPVQLNVLLCPAAEVALQTDVGVFSTNGDRVYTTHYYGILGPIDEPEFDSLTSTTFPFNYGCPGGTNIHQRSTPFDGVDYDFDGDFGGFSRYPGGSVYAMDSIGVFGMYDSLGSRDIKDGENETILFGEISWNDGLTGVTPPYRHWLRGGRNIDNLIETTSCSAKNIRFEIGSNNASNFNSISLGSAHVDGVNIGMASGAIRYFSDQTDLSVLLALASANEDEVINEKDLD